MIPVRPERSEAKTSVHPERSGAKSKDALFVLATVLMVAALAGCGGGCGGGGGGKTAALPTPVPIGELPQGSMLEPGTILPGSSRTLQNPDGTRTVVTCPDGGPACVVTLGPDGAPQSTGGEPTVETFSTIELPDGHELRAGTIRAGESPRTVHRTFDTRTVVTCPAGGDDCDVTTVTKNGAESRGGALTVTTYTTLYLPSRHTLTEGTTVPAGEVRTIGYSKGRSYILVCPFDGEACVVVSLGEDGVAESTGGTPYIVSTITNQIVWAANNGPDGTSNGAHARGFVEERLLSSGALNNVFTDDPVRQTANVQSTASSEPSFAPTASWASSDTAPTLGLVRGSFTYSVDEDSEVPALGKGWNGAALIYTVSSARNGGVIYSNIEKQLDGEDMDPYYLTFGVWLEVPNDPANSAWYSMGAFADGSSASRNARSSLNSQVDTATYRGPATGFYTKATYRGSGGARALESAEVGSFTALANLSADFGQTTTAITGFGGSVTNFRENGESLGDWEMSLEGTSANPSGNDQLFVGNTSGSAQGRSLTGKWGVEFYRNGTAALADHASGTFSASTAAANNNALFLIGAFGVEKQ